MNKQKYVCACESSELQFRCLEHSPQTVETIYDVQATERVKLLCVQLRLHLNHSGKRTLFNSSFRYYTCFFRNQTWQTIHSDYQCFLLLTEK